MRLASDARQPGCLCNAPMMFRTLERGGLSKPSSFHSFQRVLQIYFVFAREANGDAQTVDLLRGKE